LELLLPARADTASQIRIPRIELMPNLPQPFAMGLEAGARDYDASGLRPPDEGAVLP
jgi:hypothetical protein